MYIIVIGSYMFSVISILNNVHIVHPPPPHLSARGGWTSYQIFKKGGPDRASHFEKGVAGKEGGNFFQGFAIFTKKLN